MTSTNDLAKLVPGFDFLQGLMKGSGAALPGIGQWIAPTLDPAELGKRIDELRTVQFWLEQNAKLLGTTIQALEVQRMTLATLRGMNLPMADLTEALKVKPAEPPRAAVRAAAEAPAPAPAAPRTGAGGAGATAKAAAGTGAAVDPMQWWGALTQQFTELATSAMQEGSAEMARSFAAAATVPKAAAGGAERKERTDEVSSIERAMKRSLGAAAPAAASPSPPAGTRRQGAAKAATRTAAGGAGTPAPAAGARRRKARAAPAG